MTTRLRFGPFELDVQAAELRKGGTLIKLHGQPLRVLMLLAGRPGETLAREDIRREIWGEDTFVDFDQGLNFCIKQIRGHLNDDARTPQYVETLPRRGYRFIAPVEVLKDEAEGAAATASEIPPSPAPQPASRRRNGLMIGIAAAVTVIATVIYLAGWRPGAPLAARKTMLLVLPFDNLSGDSRQEYFSAGMTEEITTHLGRLDPQWLGVIARTSPSRSGSAGYAGRDIARMGRELGADYVVEGSVRLADNQVRITARLSRVREGTYIWVDSYDRSLSDVLALQGDVARDIGRKVHVRLARSGSPLAAARPVRADVYDRYLRGRFFWNKRTRESMTKAVALFAEAVSLDPGYAAAYAGLADAYSALAHYGILPPREGYLKSKEAALKGLELDSNLADAHTALAAVRVEYEWDFEAARKGFERAIELNPSYPTARRWFAHYWSAVGRPELAVEEARRALELDPLSPVMNSALGRHLYHAGRYEEAIAQLRKAIELDPGLALARLHLGWTYEARGELGKAIPEYGRAVDLTARDPSMVAALARASAAAGRREEARRLLTELLHQSGRRYVSPCDIALVYAAMGDDGAAAEWMEKAGEERSGALVFLRRHPWTARLRALPRIAALLERLGLPG